MAEKRMKPMPTDYRISARTLPVVWKAMVESVRGFADKRRPKFRNRVLGNEAYINVAVWHFTEMPIDAQEAVLREYLPRLERDLVAEDESHSADPPKSSGNFEQTTVIHAKAQPKRSPKRA